MTQSRKKAGCVEDCRVQYFEDRVSSSLRIHVFACKQVALSGDSKVCLCDLFVARALTNVSYKCRLA